MKKINVIATAIALAATIGIVACTGQPATTPETTDTEGSAAIGMQIPNPWKEYTGIKDAEEAVGFEIDVPEGIDGYDEQLVQGMDDMIEVRFINGDDQIDIRKSVGTDDNSGVYDTFENVTTETINGNEVTISGNGDLAYLATWTAGDYTFSVYANNGIAQADLITIVAAVA